MENNITSAFVFYGKKFQELRKRKHITLREMSTLLGKTTRTIGAWERNERRPSLSDIKILADILSVEIKELSNIKINQFMEKTKILDNILSTEEKINKLFEAKLNIEQKAFLHTLLNHYKRTMDSEKALEEEIKLYDAVINSAPLAIYSKDKFGHYKLVNKYFRQLTELTHENIIGSSDFNVLPEEYRKPIKKVEDKVFESYKPVYFNTISLAESNYQKFLSLSVIPVIENNQVVSIIGFIGDISARMNAMQNYKIMEQLVEQIFSAIWVQYKKPIPHMTFLNSVVQNIFGRSQQEFNNNPNIWKELIHPDDQLKVKKWSQEWFNNSNNPNIKNSMVYRIIDTKGNVKKIIDKRSNYITDDGETLECGSFTVLESED